MKSLIFIGVINFFITQGFAQTFPKDGFKASCPCALKLVMDSQKGQGDKLRVFQCVSQSSGEIATIHRVQIVKMRTRITDVTAFTNSTYAEYSKMGYAQKTTFRGFPAVQFDETVEVEGHQLQQKTLNLLHGDRCYIISVTSNSPNFDKLFATFKANFSFTN